MDTKKSLDDAGGKRRRRGTLRQAITAMLLAATSASALSQVMLVPPPRPRHEMIPPPRPGHAWHRGYWRWAHGGYVWAPGYWVVPPYGEYTVIPAPAPPRVERLSADALFAFDRGDVSDISASGRADLAEIAARLRSNHFSHVEVRGYTDRLGADSYNLDLSQRRANAVKAVLVAQGVPAEKIRAVGLGKQDPVVQCPGLGGPALIQCLRPNRRVEIVTYVSDDPRWRE